MLVTMALSGTLVGRLETRFSFKSQLCMGTVLIALACGGFAFLRHDIWQLALTSAVFGLGLGLAMPHPAGARLGIEAHCDIRRCCTSLASRPFCKMWIIAHSPAEALVRSWHYRSSPRAPDIPRVTTG